MRIVQLMTDRSRYFNPSKNYWFSFNAFLISLIDLYFRCLVLVNAARPDGAFLFVVWFIHWKRMILPFLFRDRPFNLQGGLWLFVSFRNLFSDNTRVRIFIFFVAHSTNFFFPEFNIRLYDNNSESDFVFPPPKSEYFFQQHWESEYLFRKKTNPSPFSS